MSDNQPVLPFHKRIFKNKAFIPFSLFIVIILLFVLSSRFAERPPVIHSIAPEIGSPGDVLVITGTNFGNTRNGGEVVIAGARPTTSSYVEWTNERISVQIPPDAGSGMIYVNNGQGRSKGLLFTNRLHIPVVVEGPAEPGQPYIESMTPNKGNVGTLITISGMNFGRQQGGGLVYFTPVPVPDDIRREGEDPLQQLLPARKIDYDYVSWSNSEIKVYVPDGSSSGTITLVTDRGKSNSVYFEVVEQAGAKILKAKRGYQIQYGVQVFNINAEPGNSLYLWVPRLYLGLEQTNSELIAEPEAFWDTFPGSLVYRFNDIQTAGRYSVGHTYWFERYSVETKINSAKVDQNYNQERKLYTVNISPDSFIPSDSEIIKDIAASLIRREKNPYLKAKLIFDYVLRRYTYTGNPSETDLLASIDTREGDAYMYSMVLCALLRSGGVPARPIAGYLVYGNKRTVRHYWAEFYLENFGWVPVDPALADGALFGDFPGMEDPETYYFGNIDNQHIVFSRGILETTQITPSGRPIGKKRMFSLQNIHEEASGNLNAYSSIWQDVSIIDWW